MPANIPRQAGEATSRRTGHARGPEARRLYPHLFRHSIAVHLLQGGADIRHIQAFLGHANLDTSKIYLRLVPGRLAEDYAKAMPDIAVGLDVPSPGKTGPILWRP